jgi:hypothetical protein
MSERPGWWTAWVIDPQIERCGSGAAAPVLLVALVRSVRREAVPPVVRVRVLALARGVRATYSPAA